jgi:hypothetical protein
LYPKYDRLLMKLNRITILINLSLWLISLTYSNLFNLT